MDEREQLREAKEQLKNSIKIVYRDFKLYGRAVINRNNAFIRNTGNNVINAVSRLNAEIYIHKCNKELEKLEKERQKAIKYAEELEMENIRKRTREHKEGMIEAFANQRKEERQQKLLNLRNNVKQKTSSIFSKIGKVKNSVLSGVNLANADVKIRNAFDNAQIAGLKLVGSGVSAVNSTKDKVTDFTSEQIAKYTLWRMQKEEEVNERKRQNEIRKAEELEMKNLHARTIERKNDMIEAFKNHSTEKQNLESDIDIQKNIAEIMDEKKRENGKMLNFKKGVKQRTSAFMSKIGRVGNHSITSSNLANMDVKIRNAFDNAQVWGLKAANSGVSAINNAKDKVTDFTSEQIAKYTLWRMQREENANERRRQEEIKRAEELEMKNMHMRAMEHKKGMTEALNEKERDEYNVKHEELNSQKQQLIQSLIEERNKLFSSPYTYVTDEENKGRAR